jgi:branched-chain amino acid aminotransferase
MLTAPRPNPEAVLAFYEHRVGAVVRGGALMLAPLDDHMFHRGDGVFEAIKFVDGRIYQLTEHLARLRRSAESIRLSPPCSWDDLRSIALDTVRAAQAATGLLRIFLGRGPGGFGVDPAESPFSSFYVVVSRFTPKTPDWYEKGLTGFHSSMPARPAHSAQIKDTNYLAAALMCMEARDKGKDLPFCFDEAGHLAESATANICLVDKRGVLISPEFNRILPGTTVLRAIELLRGETRCLIRQVEEKEIFAAAEVLALGTSPSCVPVVEYEGRTIADGKRGPIARLLCDLIANDIRENGVSF